MPQHPGTAPAALHAPTMMKPWPPALRPMSTRPLAMAAACQGGGGSGRVVDWWWAEGIAGGGRAWLQSSRDLRWPPTAAAHHTPMPPPQLPPPEAPDVSMPALTPRLAAMTSTISQRIALRACSTLRQPGGRR